MAIKGIKMNKQANAPNMEQDLKSVDNLATMIGGSTGLRAEMMFERLISLSIVHGKLQRNVVNRIRENVQENRKFSDRFAELLRGRIEDSDLGIRPGVDRELIKDINFLVAGRSGYTRVPLGKEAIARTLRNYEGDSTDWFEGRRDPQ